MNGLKHVACIMDGNGRWATTRGQVRIDGHAAGETALLDVIAAAESHGIPWITLFAFSTENWERPPAEVDFLMSFNHSLIQRHGDDFHRRGIRVRYLGRSDPRVPSALARAMRDIEDRTAGNDRLTLTLAFNHGGQDEIIRAVRSIVRRGVPADDIDADVLRSHLQYPDMPEPDLLIRTAGEYRLSNFLLWHLAYTELCFVDVLWPDFRGTHLLSAVDTFQQRRRRFGRIAAEVAAVPGVPQ